MFLIPMTKVMGISGSPALGTIILGHEIASVINLNTIQFCVHDVNTLTMTVYIMCIIHDLTITIILFGNHREIERKVNTRYEAAYQVNSFPPLVRARENCRPHLIFTTSPKLGIVFGTLDPSLPPLPSFPKSPSPHDHKVPEKKKLASINFVRRYTVLFDMLSTVVLQS